MGIDINKGMYALLVSITACLIGAVIDTSTHCPAGKRYGHWIFLVIYAAGLFSVLSYARF